MTPEERASIVADQERVNAEQLAKSAEELGPEITRALLERRARASAHPEIDGSALLAETETFVSRFVSYPSEHARVAHVLWIAHTHLMDCWESTPRIAFLSPEPGSGKTRALEVSELLVPRPVEAVNATPAYLFRRISDKAGMPTILFDEVDTLFGAKAREHEEVRGVLNAGHRRGAMAGRCVVKGKTVETEELPAFCAVGLAGLGALPDTILSRSVVVRMRRRAPTETIEPYRRRVHAPEGNAIRDRLAEWSKQIAPGLAGVYPEMPAGVEDRDADVWEPLLTIAEAAGGDWPTRARVAAVTLVTDAMAATPSLGVRLLADLRTVFSGNQVMSTLSILDALIKLEESPWGDLRGKPLDARRLANLLKPYAVAPATVRAGYETAKGYRREDLHDAWLRYLPPALSSLLTKVTEVTGVTGDLLGEAAKGPVTSVTSVISATNGAAHCGRCRHFKPDTGENGCGTCTHFNVDTWPEPNPTCPAFSTRGST